MVASLYIHDSVSSRCLPRLVTAMSLSVQHPTLAAANHTLCDNTTITPSHVHARSPVGLK